MDGKTHHLLPVSVTMAKNTPDARPSFPGNGHAWLVSAWALFNSLVIVVSYALAYLLDYYNVPCSQSSFFLRCSQLTDAEAGEESILFFVMLCCAASQAAAAMLSLLLPRRRHRVRRALAYLALALTIVCHCTIATDVGLNLAADPGNLFCWIFGTVAIIFFAMADSLSFLALLRGGEE